MEPVKGILRTQKRANNPFASESVIKILNYRIEQEEYSARIYESMAMWLNDNGYMGGYKEWSSYAQDEISHAKWAKEYLLDMGVQPKIPALKEPPQTFTGFPDIIYKSYQHELEVTNQCNDMAKQAMKDGDHLLYQLAHKFLQEQQEELGKTITTIDKLEAFGTDKIALRLLDNEFNS